MFWSFLLIAVHEFRCLFFSFAVNLRPIHKLDKCIQESTKFLYNLAIFDFCFDITVVIFKGLALNLTIIWKKFKFLSEKQYIIALWSLKALLFPCNIASLHIHCINCYNSFWSQKITLQVGTVFVKHDLIYWNRFPNMFLWFLWKTSN